MASLEDNIRKMMEEDRAEEAIEIIRELSGLYEQFHALSRRLIYLLTGEEKSRTGLTDFIKSVFRQRGAICREEVMLEVSENFDPTVTSKAVSDSIQYLMKTKYLEHFWDAEIKKRKYRIPRLKRK